MFKDCQLFRARDLVSVMGPCFLLCRFYGFFPYKIKSKNREVVYSKWRLIFSSIRILTYILILTCIFYQADPTEILKYVSMPGLLQGNCYMFLTTLIGIFSLLYTKTKLKLLQQLIVLSSTFNEKTFIRMSRVVHLKDILGFFILFIQAPKTLYSDNVILIIGKCMSFYSTVMVYTLDMFYVNCVYVLCVGFKNLNENLHGLRCHVITEKPYLLRRIYHRYHNPIILMELKALKERHHALSEAVQQLNNGFGFHVATTVVLTFTEVTFSLYFFILWQFDDMSPNQKNYIWYSYFVMSMIFYSVKLLIIIWTCEVTKNEALRTGNLIHEMLNSILDFDVKHELQLFSLQLLHRSNTFDAKGIVIDATLLKGIVGGIATYLLILIQFLLSSKSVK